MFLFLMKLLFITVTVIYMVARLCIILPQKIPKGMAEVTNSTKG